MTMVRRLSEQDPFVKVKGLIMCPINRLQAEAPYEAIHKSYHDERMSKATGKKERILKPMMRSTLPNLKQLLTVRLRPGENFAAQLELGVSSAAATGQHACW